ncbi:Phenylalanine--tRNA ligase beta subunit [uncultured archaeon]|nr:Phenylalanine--tRNA ligase beta subunit [uncultured archaeon]
MTVLTLNRKELEKNIGKITKEVEEKISMFGTPVESLTEEEISIEIFPNRPDVLSLQGFSRAFLAFMGKKPGLREYKVEKPEKDYKVTIDKTVKKVRPYTACAIVKNLKLTEEKIKELIDIQEKLHGSYGRNRKKLAIGIYPLEQIKLPITFLAKKPEEIKFQPLDFPKEINGRQILSQHPTGREYASLLKECEVFPVFEDGNSEILSMPPIINSDKTGKITENTKEVFIECSGFNKEYLAKTLNMVVCALSDIGGKIYGMEIIDKEKYLSPNLEPEKLNFSIENINKTLGLNLAEKEIIKNLEKMGIGYLKEKEQSIALIPCYRTDILHEIDLSEEVGIAYGYENFIPEIPQISTIGEEDKTSVLKRKISEALIGLGFIEISTYFLSTKEKQFKNIGIKDFKNEIIEVLDSKTENNILRTSLLSQSVNILSQSSDATYPQKLFELGRIFYSDEKSDTGIGEEESLCISMCDEAANFTEIKQALDYLMRMLDIKYEIREAENPSFITGRCGSIIVNNKPIGIIGEIAPFILKNNKIKMPVASLELDIENLMK